MQQQRAAALHLLAALVAVCHCNQPLEVASTQQQQHQQHQQQRTAFPLLFLLGYPQQVGPQVLPGIPIRRPQDELSVTQKPAVQADSPTADVPQNVASGDANALIREQFIQGVLQGLQSMAANGGPTIQPAVLADFLQQVNAAQSTKAPEITPPPATVEKEALHIPDNININNHNTDGDADYDYIDFKHGSRIKYELDNVEQPSNGPAEYPNKILQQPPNFDYRRPQYYLI